MTKKEILEAGGYAPKIGRPRKIRKFGVLLTPLWINSELREALERKAAAEKIEVSDARRRALYNYLGLK
jgi:hypothetical protein